MTKKLKVGFVFDDSLDRNDGVQQYVKTIARWLINHGHEVRFFVGETHNAGDMHDFVYSMSRNIRVKGNQNTLSIPLPASRQRINDVLKAESCDILHVQVPYNPMMGGRVIAQASEHTAVVGTFHIVGATLFERVGSRALRFLQYKTLKRFDEHYAVSSAAQGFASQYFDLTTVISPNVVELHRYQKGKSLQKLQGKKGTIVFVGRLVERKGVQYLIEALGCMSAEQKQGILVHICGDGELRLALEKRTKELQLSENVIFHGFITEEEKPNYLASADIAVFPSTAGESFGIVLIEAMATGNAAVIGGNNVGYATVLTEEDHLFEPTDVKAFSSKLISLLNDSQKRSSMVAWQKERVKVFDVRIVGPQLLDLYEKAVIKRTTP